MKLEMRKQAKQKKRELKKRLAKHYTQEVRRKQKRRSRYPKVVIDSTNGTPEFVDLVRQAVAVTDFDNPKFFSSGQCEFYRLLREYGFPYARRCLQEAMAQKLAEGDPMGRVGELLMLLNYGTVLFEQIPEEARRRFLPYNDVRILFIRNRMVLQFSSMLSHGGPGGAVFYGRNKPVIEFDGVQRTVAFSRHAIDRICERINPRYIHYAAAGDVHAFFSTCVYFEPVQLHGGQPAFVLYDICGNDHTLQYDTYVNQILGKDKLDRSLGRPYYKVGYCPVVFEGDFAKAKTFLSPGFTGTPEYGAILNSNLKLTERNKLIQSATSLVPNDVLMNDTPETIKWFHDNGVPQVVQLKRKVFDY